MADQPLTTTGAHAVVGMREDLADYISRLASDDTPFYSLCKKGTAKNDLAHDWTTLTLRAPGVNRKAEVRTYESTDPKRGKRLSNVCQILDEVAEVSNTVQSVDAVGDLNTIEGQLMYKGIELKRDLEYTLLSNQAKSQTDPRTMAGIQAFAGNVSVGATGTTGAADGSAALAYGTPRDISLALLNGLLQAGWSKGAKLNTLMMGAGIKLAFDAVVPEERQLAAVNTDLDRDGAMLVTTVGIWRSAFGEVRMVLNPVMSEPGLNLDRVILGFDGRGEYTPKVCNLPGRNFVEIPLAKTKSTDRSAIEWEGTLEVPNPDAVAILAALNLPA